MIRETSPFTPWDDRRLYAVSALVSAGFFALVVRLFYLQVVRGMDMERRAELNSTQILPLPAPRGWIWVRDGETETVALENAPRFSLFYSHSQKSAPSFGAVESELCARMPEMADVVRKKMEKARKTGKITRILSNIPSPVAIALMERRALMPGVNILAEQQRRARGGSFACHVLGYVGEVDEAELRRARDGGVRAGQWIGKSGLEKAYDSFLRGVDGGLQFEVDAAGRHVQVVRHIPPQPGFSVHLTLDKKIQSAAEAGLELSPTGRGAAVALDPRTGAVLALASAPGFDPSSGLETYRGDRRLPFFNRALQGVYPPGSVFKLVTAISALETVRWDTRQSYFCNGFYQLGSKQIGCWSKHGRKDFFGAVAWSCNVYFFNIGRAVGGDAIETMARAFGFGEKTGVDIPGESTGLLAGPAWKKSFRREGWYEGDTLNISIGQGGLTATPMQAAVFMAALATDGKVWQPYLVDRILDGSDRPVFKALARTRRSVDVGGALWATIHRAMEGVVTEGSGRVVYRPDLVIGAKTGTAQNPHGEDHAWFAAYAGRPGEPPSLALAVFVENGGHGSAAAGPIARDMINAYFPPDRSPLPSAGR